MTTTGKQLARRMLRAALADTELYAELARDPGAKTIYLVSTVVAMMRTCRLPSSSLDNCLLPWYTVRWSPACSLPDFSRKFLRKKFLICCAHAFETLSIALAP